MKDPLSAGFKQGSYGNKFGRAWCLDLQTCDTPGSFECGVWPVDVTFTPATAGAFQAKLLVHSNDQGEPEIVVLMNGKGQGSPVPLGCGGGEIQW
ncbi:MAG: hypothetical protein FJ109_14750 [Deltaproteobacteria bacterium]|nr:hypothetical protein [Deltaproteobacteria bacterium]